MKLLATQKKGIILSPELCDILNKLMKSDEDNATGDIQLLGKLFSGERCSYHYSTEESRVIPQNTPFSILGSTQLQNAAKLIAKMDHGHGLVDRMLIATPLAYRPTLSEMESATEQLSTEVVEDFEEYFQNVGETADHIQFTLAEDAKFMYRETIDKLAGYSEVAPERQLQINTSKATKTNVNPLVSTPSNIVPYGTMTYCL